MDEHLRNLQREALATGDPWIIYRFRLEAVRQGRPELAQFLLGDVVLVNEASRPWIEGSWYGTIVELRKEWIGGDTPTRIKPTNKQIFRYVSGPPDKLYLKTGLFLTQNDQKLLIYPVAPDDRSAKRILLRAGVSRNLLPHFLI